MTPRNIAIRLRASYKELTTTVGDWALLAKRLVCYEHPEPDNIHCHLLMTDVYCTDQHLKDLMHDHGVSLKGAGQLSFKSTYKDVNTKENMEITEQTISKYITYMSKGKYEPNYVMGYDDETIKACKDAWIVYKSKPKSFLTYKEFEAVFQATSDNVSVGDIKRAAHVYCMTKYHSHTRQCRNEISQLIDDYCYYHGVDKQYHIPHQDTK